MDITRPQKVGTQISVSNSRLGIKKKGVLTVRFGVLSWTNGTCRAGWVARGCELRAHRPDGWHADRSLGPANRDGDRYGPLKALRGLLFGYLGGLWFRMLGGRR